MGGLALAVGILVDDATVTIENINWHLEQGKDVQTAILDGAAQIVTPAFVSLLCICIVFVPMFFLEGVARFLFVPDGDGGDVRDGVLVHPVAHAGADDGDVPAAAAFARGGDGAVVQSAGATSSAISRRSSSAFAAATKQLLALAMSHRRGFVTGFMLFVLASFALVPFLGRNFFPSVDAGQIMIHFRAQPGTRVEETAESSARMQAAIRADHSAGRAGSCWWTTSACRSPAST